MKTAVITGATSFIGLHLINKLINEDWKIYAVVRGNSPRADLLPVNEQIEVIRLEMEEYIHLDKMIQKPCDAYVSLAWNGTRGETRADEQRQEENYRYSMDALKAIKNIGCKTIISAGSQAEYGPMSDKINEEYKCDPNTAYGKWKLKYYKDAMKFSLENGISFKEPRFFSLYGEDDNENTMVLSILSDMMANRQCRLTKAIQLWDFLYIDDAIEGVYRLMVQECEDGAYNFGSGDIRQLKEFIMEMYKITNSRSELLFGAVPYPSTGMVNVCPDISKLQKQTGWTAKLDFSAGIKRIVEYKRKTGYRA